MKLALPRFMILAFIALSLLAGQSIQAQASPATASTLTAQDPTQIVTPLRPFPECYGIQVMKVGGGVVRVTMFGTSVRDYIGFGNYGLLRASVFTKGGRLKSSAEYNASWRTGSRFYLDAVRGNRIAFELSGSQIECASTVRVK